MKNKLLFYLIIVTLFFSVRIAKAQEASITIEEVTFKDGDDNVVDPPYNFCPGDNYTIEITVKAEATLTFPQDMYLVVTLSNAMGDFFKIKANTDFDDETITLNYTVPTWSDNETVDAQITPALGETGDIISTNTPSFGVALSNSCGSDGGGSSTPPPPPANVACTYNFSRPTPGSNTVAGDQIYYSLVKGQKVQPCTFVGSYEGSTDRNWCRNFIWWRSDNYGTPYAIKRNLSPYCNYTTTTDYDFDCTLPQITFTGGTQVIQVIRDYQLITPSGSVSSDNWSNGYTWTTITLTDKHMLAGYSISTSATTVACYQTLTLSFPGLVNANYNWQTQGGTFSETEREQYDNSSVTGTFYTAGYKNVSLTVTATDNSFPPITFTTQIYVAPTELYFTVPPITANANTPLTIDLGLPNIPNGTYTWNIPGAVFSTPPTNICNIESFTSSHLNSTYSVTFNPGQTGCIGPVTETASLNVTDNTLQFNGTQYAQVPNDTSYNIGTRDFTMEAWIKASSTQVAYPQIMSYRTTSSNGFLFGLFSNGRPFVQMGGSTGNWLCNTCPDLRDNSCHHVAITRSGSTLSYYLDGNFMYSQPAANTTRNIQSPGSLQIGRDIASPGNTYFNGSIDDLRLWGYARSATDIKNNYELLNIPGTGGLLGYWKMHEGSGQTIANSIHNWGNGTLGATSGAESTDPVWGQYTCTNLNYRTAPIIVNTNFEDDSLTFSQPGTEADIKVYPNPVKDYISINLDNGDSKATVDVTLYNLLGIAIFQKSGLKQGEGYNISDYNLPAGVYALEVKSIYGTWTKRIVKE